jgi:hypothetical protein
LHYFLHYLASVCSICSADDGEFDNIQPSFTAFNLADKSLTAAEPFGCLHLSQPGLSAGAAQQVHQL